MELKLSKKQKEFIDAVGSSTIYVDWHQNPPKVTFNRIVIMGKVISQDIADFRTFWVLSFTNVIKFIGGIVEDEFTINWEEINNGI